MLSAFAFAVAVLGAPAADSSSVFASSTFSELVASGTSTASSPAASTSDFLPPAKGFIDLDPNEPLWSEGSPAESAVPIRGDLGASVLGPDNIPVDLQNPDLLAGPSTDHGSVYVGQPDISDLLELTINSQCQRQMAFRVKPQPTRRWGLGASAKPSVF